MRKIIRLFLKLFGINSLFLKGMLGMDPYYSDLEKFKKQKGNDLTFYFGKNYPVITDRNSDAGTMSGHYFHQDLYIAHRIFINNPDRHVDIGSRIDGFVAHLAVFRPIEVLDIRKQNSKVKNISFKQADLMQLPLDMVDYCDSISSLHSIEHFGLGRYGDPIDFYGHLKGIQNITEILKAGGRFYFSVPIGSQRIEFNAHRIFSIRYLLKLLKESFEIEHFSYVDDKGDFYEDVEFSETSIESNFYCNMGCGIFELIKR
jgi:SAM-dependent methyltransferase